MEQSNYNNRSVQTIIRLIDRSSNIITVSDGSQWRIDPRLFDLDGSNPGDSLLIRSNGRSYDITGPSVTVFPNTLGSGGPIVAVKAPATTMLTIIILGINKYLVEPVEWMQLRF